MSGNKRKFSNLANFFEQIPNIRKSIINKNNKMNIIKKLYFSNFRYSTTACVASAKTLLALMKEGKKFNWPASRWWVVLIQCWTASIVM